MRHEKNHENILNIFRIIIMIIMMTSETQVWRHGKINDGCDDDGGGGDAFVCYSFEPDLNQSTIACTSLTL